MELAGEIRNRNVTQVPCGTGSHTEGAIRPRYDCQSFDEKDSLWLTTVTPIHTLVFLRQSVR